MSIKKLKADRLKLLKIIYDITDGDSAKMVHVHKANDKLNWSNDYFDKVLNYLRENMLIESKTLAGLHVITTYGIDEVEESMENLETGDIYDESYYENAENKIDLVLADLEKLKHGQEIIFDEINSLKSSLRKLSKKDFSQLVLGKIFDLVISQNLPKDLGKKMISQLTDFSIEKFIGGGI